MTSHEHRRFAPAKMTPAQSEAYRRLVRKWRDAWRAEMAARQGETDGGRTSRLVQDESPKRANAPPAAKSERQKPERQKPERHQAAKFAAAIARDAFGRFYWNGKQARQLAEAANHNGAAKHAGSGKRRS